MAALETAQAEYDVAKQVKAAADRAAREAHDNVVKTRVALEAAQWDAAKAIPVDRTQQQLVSGDPVPADRSHTEHKPNGQQKDYVVLSEAERAKGFVRPVRRSYVHQKCGTLTKMSQPLAETYARDPYFYSGTFCCRCGNHFPVGEGGEFVWADTDQKVGT